MESILGDESVNHLSKNNLIRASGQDQVPNHASELRGLGR